MCKAVRDLCTKHAGHCVFTTEVAFESSLTCQPGVFIACKEERASTFGRSEGVEELARSKDHQEFPVYQAYAAPSESLASTLSFPVADLEIMKGGFLMP